MKSPLTYHVSAQSLLPGGEVELRIRILPLGIQDFERRRRKQARIVSKWLYGA